MSLVIFLLITLSLIAANLPWLNDRFLVFFDIPGHQKDHKTEKFRLLEWFIYFILIGVIALGFEIRSIGERHSQDWEFYAITFFMFIVFSIPGYVYHHFFRGKF